MRILFIICMSLVWYYAFQPSMDWPELPPPLLALAWGVSQLLLFQILQKKQKENNSNNPKNKKKNE